MNSDLERIRGGEGAKFNSSLADLERMHNLLIAANHASVQGDFVVWLGSLQALDREISPYLSDKENEVLNEKRVTSIPSSIQASSVIKNKLNDYERELRKFRSVKKLGIVAQDDASTAALN